MNADLMDANRRHDVRTTELADEVLKGNDIVEQLSREVSVLRGKLKRKQERLHEQVCLCLHMVTFVLFV